MVYKGCPRCGGDMRTEEDLASRLMDLVCFQCGHHQDPPGDLEVRHPETEINTSTWLMAETRPRRSAYAP